MESPPSLSRMRTTMAPNQHEENTCTAHMIARLFVQNIFKLPGMLNDACNSFLHTDEFYKLEANSSDVSLEILQEYCINDDSVLKLIMYLYVYFLIIEQYTHILKDGLKPAILGSAINYVTEQINKRHFPENIQQYKKKIIPFLDKKGEIKVFIHIEDMRPKKITRRFLEKIKREYIGCGLYPIRRDVPLRGHAIVISDFYNNMLTIKDSYGVSNSEIHVTDFLTTGYNNYTPGFFIYLSTTSGGQTKRIKRNKQSYRKNY